MKTDMPISRDEAADALRDISQTQRRSGQAFSYSSASPFLLLWGVLWFIGYGGVDVVPKFAGWLWLAIAISGSFASALIGMRIKSEPQRFSPRIFFTWIAALAAVNSIFVIMRPVSGMQIGAIIPLLVGWSYVVMGIWMGARLAVAGLVIVALTLFGFFYIPVHFALWMAAVGGSALTLAGSG